MNGKQKERFDQLIQYYNENIMDADKEMLDSHEDSPEVAKLLRFQTLVHLVLSARAKDSTTEIVVDGLSKIKGGLTPQTILNTDSKVIQSIICKLPGWKRKLVYLKKIAEICATKYNNDIPSNVEELLELPGVGPKISILAMDSCWKESVGIGVDTHVHRLANKLGFVKTKTPEKTEETLQEIIPKDQWRSLNLAMYHLGQDICTSKKPKCSECPIYSCRFNKTKQNHEKEDKNQTTLDIEEM